jgi:hypothetical protein
MDAAKVFVLVLSVLSLGTIIYLHWMSVRARRDSPLQVPRRIGWTVKRDKNKSVRERYPNTMVILQPATS